MNIRIILDMTVADDTEPTALAQAIADFLMIDNEDLFPAILTVNDYQARMEEV